MTFRLPIAFLSCAALFTVVRAADEDNTPKTSVKDMLRARMAEEAKKAPATPAPKPPPTAANPVAAPVTSATEKSEKAPAPVASANNASTPATPAATPTPETGKDAPAKPPQPTTVMPKVEVKKGRITVLDQQLAKQEEDIARERKNMKASEVDTALNDAKVAKPLALFGGESTQFRQRVSSERVELMEAEKDIMEAIARAKTKEEKQELQKQLDQIRSFRRDLEKSLR